MSTPLPRWVFAIAAVAILAGVGFSLVHFHVIRLELDDEHEEEEERDRQRDHYWRVQVSIRGEGAVISVVPAIDCRATSKGTEGQCGPVLLRFKELSPPLLEAKPNAGWRLERWEASTRFADGATARRPDPMPDGRYYLNGFGYEDTGALESVTAVFVPIESK